MFEYTFLLVCGTITRESNNRFEKHGKRDEKSTDCIIVSPVLSLFTLEEYQY